MTDIKVTAHDLTFIEYYNMLKYGSYIGVKPTDKSVVLLESIIKKLKLKNPIAIDDLHVTLMYSGMKGIPTFYPYKDNIYKAVGYKLEVWEDVLVIRLISPDLHDRFNDLSYRGFVHSYEKYIPHITLSYDYKNEKLDDKLVDNIGLEFSNEYHDPITEE